MPSCVSIIIPCYNAEKWLGEAIESALMQDYRWIEVVVADDGSVDESQAVAAEFRRRVRYVHQPNRGSSAARNLGVRHATGELIQFLDADDLLHRKRLSTMMEAWKLQPEVPFVAASYRSFSIGEAGFREIVECGLGDTPHAAQRDALSANYLPWAGLFRREFLAEIGPWNENLTRWVDLEYHARIAARTNSFIFVDAPLYGYRQHEGPRISNHNRSHTALEAAEASLQAARRALEVGGVLSSERRAYLFPFYVLLARGSAKSGDRERFLRMMAEATMCSDRPWFRAKSAAATTVARLAGLRAASALMEGVLARRHAVAHSNAPPKARFSPR